MKVLKVVGSVLLGLIGLAVLLYVIGVAVNWRDQPPSAAALAMKKILADRAPVADADNGFVYAHGVLGGGVGRSPNGRSDAGGLARGGQPRSGVDRCRSAEENSSTSSLATSPSMERLKAPCGEAPSAECREAFVAALSQPRVALQDLQLARYRALLQRTAWREVVPLDMSAAPIPSFRDHPRGTATSVRRSCNASEIRAARRDRRDDAQRSRVLARNPEVRRLPDHQDDCRRRDSSPFPVRQPRAARNAGGPRPK